MAEDEFEQYMSGNLILPNTWDSALIMLESMHLMNEHFAVLEELRNRHENLTKGVETLRKQMLRFRDEISGSTSTILARAPLRVRPRKTPTDIDSESPNPDTLPSPIAPVVLAPLSEKPRLKPKDERFTAECNFFSETLRLSQNVDFSVSESQSMDELKSVDYDIDLSEEKGAATSSIELARRARSGDDRESSDALLGLSFNSDNVSLLDSAGSPTSNLWLPSPLKPVQSMFSSNSWDIPSIPCNTGEFNSLQHVSEDSQPDKPGGH